MRARAIVAAVVAGILVSGTSSIHAKPPRKAGLPYRMEDVNHHVAGPGFGGGVWNTEDAYEFPLRRRERFISVSISDDGEGPVAGVIVQWVTDIDAGSASAGHAETYEHFCGATESPVRVRPRITVEILINKGTCQDGTPSLPTEGHIYAEFYRK